MLDVFFMFFLKFKLNHKNEVQGPSKRFTLKVETSGLPAYIKQKNNKL